MRNETSETILGVGVDIVDIARCVEKLQQRPGLADSVCAPGEVSPRDAAAFARRWAVKEAVIKCCPTAVFAREVLVTHTALGAVQARVISKGYEDSLFEVSVSDDAGVAVAVCLRLR
jgi:holo-[acyl-carrier protein] synthase